MPVSADLGKPLEDDLNELVKTGRYRSRSEVLREGMRLVQERETRLAALDSLIAKGLCDVEEGRTKPANEAFENLIEHYSDK